MLGTSKTASLMMMAAIAGMVGGGRDALSGAASPMTLSRRQMGRVMSSTHRVGYGGNRPIGAPVGTYWRGDGVLPQGETRQMRRGRERAEAKKQRA